MIRHSTCIAMRALVTWIKAFVVKTVLAVKSPGHLATHSELHPLMLLADACAKKSKSDILKTTTEERRTKLQQTYQLTESDQNYL